VLGRKDTCGLPSHGARLSQRYAGVCWERTARRLVAAFVREAERDSGEGRLDDGDVKPAEMRSHRICPNPADRRGTLSDRRGVAYRSCPAVGRNSLASSGDAVGLGELPPAQREPIAGHKAVYGRPAAANRHLCADRIGLTGDAHYWDEERHHPTSSFRCDFVGHRFATDGIGSAPGVNAAADDSDAPRQLAVVTTYEMEVGES
jgi:hypothetical protein